jgi:hypothetical protein
LQGNYPEEVDDNLFARRQALKRLPILFSLADSSFQPAFPEIRN